MQEYNSKHTLIALLILVLTSVGVGAGAMYLGSWYYDVHDSNRTARTVQQVCDDYRETMNPDLYRTCGDAQEVSNSEYLCTKPPIVSCWVEVK